MSHYATLDDVQRRMPQFQLTETSKPNIETAQTFLDDTHAQYESAIEGLGYVTPITGPKSLAQSKEYVSQGTICKILYARAAAVGTDVAVQSAERACKQYYDALAMLADPNSPLELSDAETTEEMMDKDGLPPMGLLVDENGDPIVARIRMDSKF
jgi:hypothetical protein